MAGNPERLALAVLTFVTLLNLAGAVEASPADLAPIALTANRSGTFLFVAEANARQVAVFDLTARNVRQTVDTSGQPTGLTLSPDERCLYVTCEGPEGIIDVIDPTTGRKTRQLRAGHTPMAPLLSADGKLLFVCSRFHNSLQVVDLETGQIAAQIPVLREPVAAVLTLNGTRLLVGNHLPNGPADGAFMAAAVSVIDVGTRNTTGLIQLPNGSMSLRGMCLSPDGKQAYVTHLLARYQVPTTQLDRGWMSTNALSIIDVAEARLVNTVLLDDIDLGAANPWGVTCTADGRYLCVAHAGTHEISIIDRAGLLDRLARLAAGERVSEVSVTPADVPDDLSFLTGLRRRFPLAGNGPRGLIAVGTRLYAAEYFSDSLGEIDVNTMAKAGSGAPLRKSTDATRTPPGPADSHQAGALRGLSLALKATDADGQVRQGGLWSAAVKRLGRSDTPPPGQAHRGEMLFNDATLSFQHWQSCASCHPDGRADGPNWDLLNDGIGNPKNTRSLLMSPHTPPVMSLGVRANTKVAIAAGFRFILFTDRPKEDVDAVDDYLRSMKPVPSPYLADGRLSPAAERGRQVFASAGCADCHPSPLYTNNRSYNVGTGLGTQKDRLFDTPTLLEVWRTAPYLHDGRAATMEELFKKHNPDDRHGRTSGLSPEDLAAMVEYVLSL
ncbi:MAG: cell surface protein [Phycisphaerae bacterium]|nr:cell surface protein [Phycisphaerae bacterium]